MSILCALILALSITPNGKRIVIGLLVSFKFGKLTLFALDQSKYSELSAVAQKSLSSSSFLNLGIVLNFLFGFIFFSFFSIYISSGNYPYLVLPHCKNDT